MRPTSRKHTFDYDYFKDIDSADKAYWLGFIQCDAHINKTCLDICLCSEDIGHLTKFNNSMSSNVPIRHRKIKLSGYDKEYDADRLTLYSVDIVKPLFKLGIEKFKSSTMETILDYTSPYILDYIRGIVDANGCIFVNTEKRSNDIIRISSGSYLFVEQLHEILHKILVNKNVHTNHISTTKHEVSLYGSNAVALLRLIYSSGICLERKLAKANAVIGQYCLEDQ